MHCGAPHTAGERLGDDLLKSSGKKGSWAFRRTVLSGAPDKARERLGDNLADASIQSAEGKGLGHGQWLDAQCCLRRSLKSQGAPRRRPSVGRRENSRRARN